MSFRAVHASHQSVEVSRSFAEMLASLERAHEACLSHRRIVHTFRADVITLMSESLMAIADFIRPFFLTSDYRHFFTF